MPHKILTILGTRPEAIKLAPVIHELASSEFKSVVLSTGQHGEILKQVLEFFSIQPDVHLDLMGGSKNISILLGRAVKNIGEILLKEKPDLIIVQGDTTSALAGAISGGYHQIPVAHVEAGLRSGDVRNPWPEEMNRKMISSTASLHFAPLFENQQNLIKENIPLNTIHVTGNTVIDALMLATERLKENPINIAAVNPEKDLILATMHRRESLGSGMVEICEALKELSTHPNVQIIIPVHPNPKVFQIVRKILVGVENVTILSPLNYPQFVSLMNMSKLIITDSGGVQEEAPALGKFVLVTREKTERNCPLVELVGTDRKLIVQKSLEILENKEIFEPSKFFGDGKAAPRIVQHIREFLV